MELGPWFQRHGRQMLTPFEGDEDLLDLPHIRFGLSLPIKAAYLGLQGEALQKYLLQLNEKEPV